MIECILKRMQIDSSEAIGLDLLTNFSTLQFKLITYALKFNLKCSKNFGGLINLLEVSESVNMN